MTKPLETWSVAEFEAWLRSGAAERLDNEFKDSRALSKDDAAKNELSKDASAFANSAGGRLIYGVKELADKSFRVDGGIDPKQFQLEWIEQILNSRIRPRINGVRLYGIADPATGKYYPVIEVPESDNAHQASDRKYYKRFNLHAEPMEDHEVRATMNRARHPIVEPEFSLVRTEFIAQSNLAKFEAGLVLRNTGRVRARDIRFELDFPETCLTEVNSMRGLTVQNLALNKVGRRTKRIILRIREDSIFPGDEARYEYLLRFQLSTEHLRWAKIEDWTMSWRTFADDSPMRDGRLQLLTWCNL